MPTRDAKKGFWGQLTSTFAAPKPDTLAGRVWNNVTGLHIWIFRKSGGRIGASFDGAPLCILHHRGAKSGLPRETPMIHMVDGSRVIVVASMGGNPKNPAWFHNLKAHPDIEIETSGRRLPLRARVATDAERAELWPRLLEIWPAWADYETRTTRTMPVVICEPR